MASLPTELFHQIIEHLSQKDLCEYLRVNSHWYYAILPVLYNRVRFKNSSDRQQQFFDMAATSYTQIGLHVKHLSFFRNTSDCLFPGKSIVHKIMSNSRNLQTIDAACFSLFIDYLNTADVSDFPQLRSIKAIPLAVGLDNYMNCLVRYKDTITEIEFNYQIYHHLVETDTISQIGLYLMQFHYLDRFTFNAYHGSSQHSISLGEVINHCPKLVDLNYTAPWVADDSAFNLVNKSHPLLRHLTWNCLCLDQTMLQTVTAAFPGLKTLSLKTERCRVEGREVIDKLMKMSHLQEWTLSANQSKQALNMVRKLHEMLDGRHWTFSTEVGNSDVIMAIDTLTLTMDFKHKRLHSKWEGEISKDWYQNTYGHLLTALTINHYDRSVDLSEVNASCPGLQRLEVNASDLVYSFDRVQPRLNKLVLHKNPLQSEAFQKIASIYPNVHTLHLHYLTYPTNRREKQSTQFLTLPPFKLQKLILTRQDDFCKRFKMIIQQTVGQVPISQWEYGGGYRYLRTTTPRPVIERHSQQEMPVYQWKYEKGAKVMVAYSRPIEVDSDYTVHNITHRHIQQVIFSVVSSYYC